VSLRSYRLPKGMVEPVNLVLTSSLQTIHALGTQPKPLDKAIDAQPAATLPQTSRRFGVWGRCSRLGSSPRSATSILSSPRPANFAADSSQVAQISVG